MSFISIVENLQGTVFLFYIHISNQVHFLWKYLFKKGLKNMFFKNKEQPTLDFKFMPKAAKVRVQNIINLKYTLEHI